MRFYRLFVVNRMTFYAYLFRAGLEQRLIVGRMGPVALQTISFFHRIMLVFL